MKTSSSVLLISILASSLLSADTVAKAVVLDNNGNPTNSVGEKVVKVKVVDGMID